MRNEQYVLLSGRRLTQPVTENQIAATIAAAVNEDYAVENAGVGKPIEDVSRQQVETVRSEGAVNTLAGASGMQASYR